MACVACHIVPEVSWDSAHFDYSLFEEPSRIDSIAEVTWNSIDTTVMWNRGANSCFNSYCHGNFTGGFFTNTPYWIGADQAACGSCHDVGANPGFIDRLHSSHARSNVGCEQCHATVVDADLEVIGPAYHVDGLKTIEFQIDSGGVFIDRTCSDLSVGCHEARDWN
ncbi:MAG: CxxxxCH/CxxCH domain-containing protein, partial [candidate division Zixibacteria bacterium]|nr:CxxxxCH/CxxCH domain-containing protein [candidate division Zixibacteria bacterium]